MKRPGLWLGAWVGLLLTVPLVVISALGNQLVGLPFVAYDLFPFVRDLTPGPVLTAVIDGMVGAITALNLGRVDEAAKVAEQGMAILMVVGFGVVAGALFFAILNALNVRSATLPGLVFGAVVGILMALISRSLGLSARTDAPTLNFGWLVFLFVVWGLLHAWAYDRLNQPAMIETSRSLPA